MRKIGYIETPFDKEWKAVESREDFERIVCSEKVSGVIHEIRTYKEKHPEATEASYREAKNNAKKRLPAFVFMGCRLDGKAGSRKELEPTGAAMIDIDTTDTPAEVIYSQYQEKGYDHHVLLAHATPSGTGLRLVVLPRSGETLEDLHYQLLTDGFAVDTACKDITRLSYACRKEDIFLLSDELFQLPEIEPSGTTHRGVLSSEKPIGLSLHPIGSFEEEYDGLKYAAIVNELTSQMGGEPAHGNRNQFIYSMACQLRHICDNNPAWIEHVMPNFGENQEKVHATILSACNREQTQRMPYTLQRALSQVRLQVVQEKASGSKPPRMPKLPKVMETILSKVPVYMRPSASQCVFPALATLVKGVVFEYIDGKLYEPGYMHTQVGPTAAGKGLINEPIQHILAPIQLRDRAARLAEEEWREAVKTSGSNKQKPAKPDLPIQCLSSNCTTAAFNERIQKADKHGHLYLYAQYNELEMIREMASANNSIAEVGKTIRLAWDNDLYGQERYGADAISGLAPIRWNWLASMTPKNCCDFFAKQLSNGVVNRIGFSVVTVDDTSRVPRSGRYDQAYDDALAPYLTHLQTAPYPTHQEDEAYAIKRFQEDGVEIEMLAMRDENQAFVIELNNGFVQVHSPEAYRLVKRLNEKNVSTYTDTQSEAFNSFRMRGNVIAFKKAMLLYLANGCVWDDDFDAFVEWSEEYDIWSKMHLFGDATETAMQGENAICCKRGKANMLEQLPSTFSLDDLLLLRQRLGVIPDRKKAQNQLHVWKNRGLIDVNEKGEYVKTVKR